MKISGKKPSVGAESYIKNAGGKEQQPNAAGGNAKSSSSDSVDISDKAREFGRIKKMLEDIPSVRVETVDRIRSDISSGAYTVDAAKVAEKMIEKALRDSLNGKK